MRRREFIGGLAGALMIGRAWGQPARRVYRIGIVGLSAASDLVGPTPRSPTLHAFLKEMRQLGHVYGENFVTEVRGSAGKSELFPSLAAELVAGQVDVIVATGAAVPTLKEATSTIPIVMAATSDPVRQGFVQSLARPGGNVTGLSLQALETMGKRLELIKELVPASGPLAVIWNAPAVDAWQAAQRAAQQRGWQLLSIEIQSLSDVEVALRKAVQVGAGGVLFYSSGIVFPHRDQVAELAANNKLPTIYDLRPYVEAGGLMSYGPEINDIWRRAAGYVDKILKGAKPADLPVEQPTKFELVINLKTAKALGLTIPQSIVLRADEVIE